MGKEASVRRTGSVKPALVLAIALYIVVVIIVGVAVNLGFLVTAVVALLPITLVLVLASVGGGRGPTESVSKTYESTGATTRVLMTAAGDTDSVRQRIKGNIEGNKRFQLIQETTTGLTVKARLNFFTWGEEIQVSLSPTVGGTAIEAECRHNQRTAVVDFGQSRRDLQRLLDRVQPVG